MATTTLQKLIDAIDRLDRKDENEFPLKVHAGMAMHRYEEATDALRSASVIPGRLDSHILREAAEADAVIGLWVEVMRASTLGTNLPVLTQEGLATVAREKAYRILSNWYTHNSTDMMHNTLVEIERAAAARVLDYVPSDLPFGNVKNELV